MKKMMQLGNNSGDSRNGHTTKTVIADNHQIEIEVPRDRNGTFEPIAIQKHQKRTPLFNDQIISLYARGMSTREIQAHLEEIYGVEVSPDLISRVTDAVLTDVVEWRNRPLEKSYPILYLDAIKVHCRQEGKSINKSLNIALAIDWEGHKEVLGMWLCENEGAKYWMGVLTELQNRGVEDILIACTDGLTGFPEAIKTVFPQTRTQLCIVHMVRNSTRFVSNKDLKTLCADLKQVYTAANEELGKSKLDEFALKWDSKYPMISRSWNNHWQDLSEFFKYPKQIRKIIYTTNAIESLNSQLRKVTKNRSTFPTDDAIYKIMYLVFRNVSKKWDKALPNWGISIHQLAVLFPDRVPKELL